MAEQKVAFQIAEGKTIEISTGKIANLANGSCVVRLGDTMVLCCVCSGPAKPGTDFLALQVDYREKYSAAGKFPGGYIKREGRPTEKEILTYKATGSVVSAHPSIHQARMGIDFASGSLGQGLSQGVGVALALRRKHNASSRVFVILGDGECDEGSVWEAAAAAAHYGLTNLIAIVDQNHLQYDGPTEKILDLADLAAKWKAFGWMTTSVDGHDIDAVASACEVSRERPLAVIARTVKGKGVPFMENVPAWHHGVVTQKVFEQAIAELDARS